MGMHVSVICACVCLSVYVNAVAPKPQSVCGDQSTLSVGACFPTYLTESPVI